MSEKLTFISDPGHGWLVVTADQMEELGLSESDISPFSYQKGELRALEEDIDAGVFLEAWKKAKGTEPDLREVHEDPTPIRNWKDFGTKSFD